MSAPDLPSGDLPASILLAAPGFADADRDACAALVAASEPDALLLVSYAGDPSDRLARCRELGADPETAMAIVVGDGAAPEADAFDAVETIGTPADLTGLGIAVTEALDSVEGSTAVCVDSVTSLLQYVDVEAAYEFLHVLTGRFYRNDAVGHLHVDPGAHDERTLARLASVVDGQVTVGEDGSIESVAAAVRDWEA